MRLGWRTVASRLAWSGRFPVFEDEIEAEFDGRRHTYTYLASRARAVSILAQGADGRILTVREYRHPLGQVVRDLPMGSLRQDEDPSAGAARELREETGYRAGKLAWFGAVHPIPALTRLRLEYFFAQNLEFVGAQRDDSEIIETDWLELGQVVAGIEAGNLQAGSIQLGVLMAAQRGLICLPPPA